MGETDAMWRAIAALVAVTALAACGGGSKAVAPATTTTDGVATTTTVGLSDAATVWCVTTENQRSINKAASTLGVTPAVSVDLLKATNVTAFWTQWGEADRDSSNAPQYPVPSTLDEQNAVVQYGPTSWFSQPDWIRVCNAAFGSR